MALDIILSVLPMIADYTVGPIKTHTCYALRCKTNLQNLKEEVGKLKNVRNDLQSSTEEETRNGNMIHQHVALWLNEVEGFIKEMESQLEQDENRRMKKCFVGLCPNFYTRYKLGKKATKELATVMAKFEESAKFGPIGYRAPPVVMDAMSVKSYEAMASRKKIFNDIMNALKVANVKMVGVYGMGGIGKTTLVKMVAREVMEQKLFDNVAVATVTRNPDIMKIQQEIGDQFGITFRDRAGEWGRAYQLREFLKQEKKILIVLDDLWKRLDLDAVGISFHDEQKDSKLLLTSRELDVLSTGMDVQNNFSIDVLEKEEAWDLFKKIAGSKVENPEVQSIASKIATKCGGLPVAIVTIAKALKDKSVPQWKDAWCQLQRPSPRNFDGVSGEVYRAIHLSYQHLEREELKSTFLLCSRMGYNASIDDLLKYGMGLGLFSDGVATTEEARNRVSSLVRELRSSCLLLDGNTCNQFSIHDVVRDVAISVAFRDHNVFVDINDGVEWGGHCKDSTLGYKEIWLHGETVKVFEDLNCINLEVFIMKSKDPSLEIPGGVFEGMEKLKVLGLINLSFSFMPSSLHLLKNLHSLCIHQSLLGEIAVIGHLKRLEILSFVESTIKHLPREIGELKKLKLLDLTDCSELEVISQNVISSLQLLQELRMGNSFHQWGIGENNASLLELEHLSNLISLDIHVPDSSIISKDLFSENLERYKIFIGDVWDWHDDYETSRTLKLKFKESTDHLKPGISKLLRRAEDLYLLELKGVKNIICELDRDGFPLLKHLHLQNSHDIQYVIDTMDMGGIISDNTFFPLLDSLFLHNLASLKMIHQGRLGTQSFGRLQILEVKDCVVMENLFFFSIGRDIEITENSNEIVVEGIKNNTMDVMEFSLLRLVRLKDLPNLRSFCSRKMMGMESGEIILEEETLIHVRVLFDEKIVFPKLEDLQLESIPNIERLWHGQPSAISVSIRNLQRMEVRRCDRLKYLFSLSMVKSLVQLKLLVVSLCSSVEEIIETEALEEEETKMLFPKLEDIELLDLPELRHICIGCLIECPLLKRLTIERCDNLETFISECEIRKVTFSNDDNGEVKLKENYCCATQPLFNEKVVFPSLAQLRIWGMNKLERIWNNQLELAGGSFCELRSIAIGSCNKLVNIFSPILLGRFQRLEELEIRYCHLLEEVFEVGGLSSTAVEGSSVSFQLRDLTLTDLPKLKHIWNKDPQGILFFHNLHTVDVLLCHGLKNLFPSSIATDGLLHLENLETKHCSGLEEIFAKADGDDEVVPRFKFPCLTSLGLVGLPKFRNVYPGKHSWECPRLKSFRVTDCPNLKIFGSNFLSSQRIEVGGQLEDDPIQQPLFLVEKVIHSLEELLLNGMETSATSILWQPHLLAAAQYSYSRLKVLNLQNFQRRSCPIPFCFLQRLGNLETLSVKDSSLKKVFLYEGFVDEEPTWMLVRFKNLILEKVDDIWILWEQDHRLAPLLRNLRRLQVCFCYSLVNLAPSVVSFKNLSTLNVHCCSELSNLVTSSTAKSFVQLVKLIIMFCSKMIEIVAKERDEEDDDEIVFSRLEYLELYDLENLTSFFPGNCMFKLPSLKEMIVERCPKMLVFSSGEVRTPKLQGVCWQRNPEIKKYWHGNLNATITEMLTFGSKRSLKLDGACINADSILWHHQLPPNIYSTFQVLKLENFGRKSSPVPCSFLQRLFNVGKLSVHKSSFRRLFLFEGFDDEEYTRILARFRNLKLESMHDQGNLWVQNHRLVQLLHNLRTLQIESCDNLVNLLPSSACFQNLSILEVSWCHGLSNLITPSTAKSFVQLVKLIVRGCSKMMEIVAKEEDEIEDDEIVLNKLEYLELNHLINLTSFCPGNYTFKFPLLKEVIVQRCPKMLIFSPRVSSTPELQDVCWLKDHGENRKCWDGNLNATIKQLYTEMVGLCGVRFLKLSDFPQLTRRWCCQLPLNFFSDLGDLTVNDSDFFSYAMPSNKLQFMNQLISLHVRNCKSFKAVFDLEGINAEEGHAQVLPNLKELQLTDLPSLMHICSMDPRGILDFKNLQSLEVHNCISFRNIFTPSMALSLECLCKIKISSCPMMEKIITEERGKGATMAADKIVFPALKVIVLDSLPNLKTILSRGSGILQFPLLEEISIENCPNLKTCVSLFLREQLSVLVNEGQEHRLQKLDHDTVSFPNMKRLSVEWNDIMEIVQSGQFRAEYFSKLESIVLMHFPNDCVDFPSRFLQNFTKLKKLVIRDATFKKILFCEGKIDGEKHSNILSQLEELELCKMPALMHLPKEDSMTSQIFQKLETLKVLECGMLGSLIPSSSSFQCLTTLEVSKCHGLITFMTSSSAKYLEQLRWMTITECKMIEEIVAEEENEVENEVTFHNLKRLRLECLPSLTSFHLGKCTLNFPSLIEVLFIECPGMRSFSEGVISTPELEKVLITEEDEEGYWEDTLNSTIKKLYFEMGDGAAQFKPPSSPEQSLLTCETTQADRNGSNDVFETQVSEDLRATGTLEANKDLPPVIATIFENKETTIEVVLTESNITRITSSSQDFDEASNDKEDLSQGQNSGPSIDSDTLISLPVQKDPHTSEKYESSWDNVMPVLFQQSNIVPITPGTSAERLSMSTFTSSSNRASSQELTLACADRNSPAAVFERQVTEDLHSTGTSENSKDLSTVVATTPKKKKTLLLTESKNTRIASSFQDFNTASNEKEDPTQSEKSSTEPLISLLVQKDSQTIDKDEPSPVQQSITSPISSSTSDEQVSMSTSASLTNRTSAQELLFSESSSSNAPVESLESYSASSKLYRGSIELIKKLVMKPPAEVAASSDCLLLLCSLKNLRNCPSLNSQQQEIVRFYVENFPTLVTNNLFDEQEIEWTNSIKISIEDHTKELAELDISSKDLTIKINRLTAVKDALNKQLHAIQEEEDLLQANKKIILAKINSREEELEIEMEALLEAGRQKRERKDRATCVDENWAKLRNLFA